MIVQRAIVCSWSHTIGPHVLCQWTPQGYMVNGGKEFEQLVARILHPEGGLDGKRAEERGERCKVLLQERNYVAHARIVHVQQRPLALILVYSAAHLQKVWLLGNAIEVALAVTLHEKSELNDATLLSRAMNQLNEMLQKVHVMQDSLQPTLQQYSKPSSVEEKDAVFLAKCLMSHLQMGCTLILTDTHDVPGTLSYRVLSYLSLFLGTTESICSRALNSGLDWSPLDTFCPGVTLQTLAIDVKGFVSTNELLKSPSAPSVVDVTRRKVRQLISNDSCAYQQRHHFHEEKCEGRSQMKTVLNSETGPLITEFFDQWLGGFDVDTNFAATEDIGLFTRHLRIRGALAVKTLTHCPRLRPTNDQPKIYLDYNSAHQFLFGISSSNGLGSGNNSSKTSPKESDLRIVLGLADKFHPGISKSVAPFHV